MKPNRETFSSIALCCVCLFMTLAPCASIGQGAEEWKRISQEGDGFLVWESNRTGRWRIWTRKLDGTGLRQLSTDEKSTRDHFCPHISPDGKRVIYLSFPETHDYKDPETGQKVQLRIIDTNGKNDRELLNNVIQGDMGDRGAVWIDSDRFIYLGRDGQTRVYSLTTTMSTKPMTTHGTRSLLDPTLRYACDRFHFHPYDRTTKTIDTTGQKLGGCEPYFTHDGRWGIRMSGAGGPITRVDLDTAELHVLLDKNDVRMPAERRYVYFPMVSRCSRLLTFGASPDQHDHFNSDYEIFVAIIDPITLAIQGKPVRYTFDGKTDRYPDVHLGEFALGTHNGKAPMRITFENEALKEDPSSWKWDYGNGEKGRKGEHQYSSPGQYDVTARRRSRRLRGRVNIRAAAPPGLTTTTLLDSQTILLRFDEAVDVSAMTLELKSGNTLSPPTIAPNGRSVTIGLPTPLTASDTLVIAGVTDCAQQPNLMPTASVPLSPLAWPVDLKSCIWAWQTGAKNDIPVDIVGKVKARAGARYTHNQAMDAYAGAFEAVGADDTILKRFTGGSAFTLEATLTSDGRIEKGPARIVSFSKHVRSCNFMIGQNKDQLVFRLRTAETDRNGRKPQITLMPIVAGETIHVTVTYDSGYLKAYRNGKKVMDSFEIKGAFTNWDPMHLVIGAEWDGDRPWNGVIEGVAIYNAALSPEEIQRSVRAYQAIRAERKTVSPFAGKAKLVARSKTPTLAEITPYNEALAIYEFVMTESTSLEFPVGAHVRAATWVWLDRKQRPIVRVPLQTEMDVTFTHKDDNPQLKSMFISDTLDFDPDMLEQHYLVRP